MGLFTLIKKTIKSLFYFFPFSEVFGHIYLKKFMTPGKECSKNM